MTIVNLPTDSIFDGEPLSPHEQDDPDLATTLTLAGLTPTGTATTISPSWGSAYGPTPTVMSTLTNDPTPLVGVTGEQRINVEMVGGSELAFSGIVSATYNPTGVGRTVFSFDKDAAQKFALALMKAAAEVE